MDRSKMRRDMLIFEYSQAGCLVVVFCVFFLVCFLTFCSTFKIYSTYE